jgi:hypothetical protein
MASRSTYPSGTPVLFVFQVILDAEKHDANKSGLDMVDKLVAADTEKYLVIVTPKEMQPKIAVPRKYLTTRLLAGRDPDVAFPIYHLLTKL